jgi:hypothetical protein
MRVLYLPIFEPGAFHDVAVRNKRGVYDALVKAGHDVVEFDYLAEMDGLRDKLAALINSHQPDLLLTQLHGHEPLTVDMLRDLRALRPDMRVVNWSGDSWRHGLVGEKYLPLVRLFDLQLIAAPDILPEYETLGIPARFWQIAYERPVGDLPDMPAYDVVFMGNVISEPRRAMLQLLRGLDGVRVGIYGDWEHADGHNTYDFGAGEALYQRAKVAIADNVYPEQQNYTSNRPIQVLVAGGAVLLHQHVPKMDVLLGIQPGVHYLEWHTLDDLRTLINAALASDTRDMVQAGRAYAETHHTYDARVRQLMEYLA